MKQAIISVDFTAQVPDDFTEDQIENITLEIPYEQIAIFRDGRPDPNAKVTGYTTTYTEVVGSINSL